MSGASAVTRVMLLALLAALALGGCDDGGGSDGDAGPTADMADETDGGDDDLGPDMADPDMAPEPEPDAAEPEPDAAEPEPDMAPEPDMTVDLGPDMAPDAFVGDLELVVESPQNGDVVNQNPLPVSGTITTFAVVTVNGVEAEVDADLRWQVEIDAPDGELAITVIAVGGAGAEEVEESLTVTVDSTAPPLIIIRPTDGATLVTDPVADGDPDPTVEVCVESEPGAELAVMGQPVAVDEAGGGCAPAPLPRLAANRIVATATDAAGNETRAEVFVNRREGVRDSDDDGDGLSLADEIEIYGTNPDAADSDEDGLDDGLEVLQYGTNPQNRDTDEDGLTDGLEVNEYGSNPLVVDTDGGGISDGQEITFGTDPTDPADDRVPLPISLFDGGGFEWDLNRQGEVVDGSDDAYDTGQRLSFADAEGDFDEWPGADGAAFELGERQVRIGPVEFGELIVDRKIYVPEDAPFARYLDLFTNPGGAPIEVLVRISGNMGSDGSTALVATSDDVEEQPPVFGPEDDWVVTDDLDEGGDPAVAHVISGAGARVEPSAATFDGDTYAFDFPLVVPAGRTVGIMTFASQNANRADAIGQAERLVVHPIDAIEGLTVAEQLAVMNFRLLDDTDDDGLPDFREVELGTNPNDPDTDADGLFDLFEVENGFDPLAPGEEGLDPDEDGLDNLAEQAAGTDPLQADPDGDGLIDPDELELGTNPNVADTDRDGLDDGEELNVHGTDPLLRDTDGGGRSDREELFVDLTDPLDPEDDLAEPPVELFDGAGFRWDILGDGSVDSGTPINDFDVTFDRAAGLTLNGAAVPARDAGLRLQAGREVVFGPSLVAELEVTRQAYVPADGQFARFVDVIRNPGDEAIEVSAEFTVDLAGFSTQFVDDSDGDGELTPADDWWIAFDEGFAVARPVVGVILSDADASAQPIAAQRNFSLLDWTFQLVVPAGGELRLMHVIAQHGAGDVDAAGANIQALLARPEAIFAGLSPLERLSIANLDVALDTDGDGLADIEEAPLGTDPNNPDTDGDGLLDGFEVDNGFDPLVGGEHALDPDADGLDNLAEQAFGSDPNAADADEDGLDDSAERDAATNPFSADSDDDGLTDPQEIELGTDPNDADTDDGGRLDGPEVTIDGTDPFDPGDDLVPVDLNHSLRDGADFLWDITGDGAIFNGTRDAYDGGLDLLVGGEAFPPFDQAFLGFGAREANIGPAEMGELVVSRRIYVPEAAQFARFVEVLTNPTGLDIDVDVTLDSNLGSDGGAQLISDSSGDGAVTPDDDWFVMDDGNLELGDPAMLHVFSDGLAPVQPSVVTQDGDDLLYTFPVTVPAGETIYVMHFAAQHDTPDDAAANLDALVPFGDVTLAGLRPEERRRVVNLRLAPDDDGDGLPNEDEVLLGTDPANPDTDGDGLLDGYEVDNGFDPLEGGDGEADPDGDGLDNLGEVAARTDPNNPDTDGDGLDDFVEVEGGTDPRSTDTDGDLLSDGEEVDLGTDPVVFDTDEGGTGDGEEVLRFGTDPLDGADDIIGVDLPRTLVDGGAAEWDLFSTGATGDGGIVDGPQDSYDTGFTLVVDGVPFPGQPDAVLQLDGQQLAFGPATLSGMRVTRRVYASPDAAFVRYVETFTNPTGAAVQAAVNIGGNLGSDADNIIIETSSGDALVDAEDDWWTSEDEGGFDPKLLFLMSDAEAAVQPEAIDATRDNFDYDFVIDVPPGQTVHLMHFAAQALDREAIAAARDVVLAFGPETLVGLSGDEQLSILNLVVANDSDGDRLTDEDEQALGTDPLNPDTDGDGLLDGFEARYGFDPLVAGEAGLDGDEDGLDNLGEQAAGTRPDLADSDGDGLDDGEEIDLGTSPVSVDTDGDGLEDGREPGLGTDPTNPDTDGDGLGDGLELELRIDPLDEDSDNDGALDGAEVEFGLDPRDAEDAALDPDEDTVPSGVEANLGSDPFDADTDDDGLDDGLEINALGTDPTNPDTDGGGRRDGDEQLIDFTDPLDPADDVPAVDLPTEILDGGGFIWDVQPNGSLTEGTDDAYDAPTFLLQVGLDTFPGQDNAFTSDDGREIYFGPAEMSGLQVSRRVYVPVEGQFIRYLEVFDNPGDQEIDVQVRITGDLGSDLGTAVVGDASGDLLVGPEDTWFATDDGELSDPPLGFACFGADADVTPATVTLADDLFTYGYDVIVAPGGRVSVMHLAGQYLDVDSANAGAAALAVPDEAALSGIDGDDRATIVNFPVAPAN